MTNSGRALGSALGPDGTSLWIRADFERAPLTLSPWLELLRYSGDFYGSDQDRGVFVTAKGPIEHRQRIGVDAQAIFSSLMLTLGLFAERVANSALVNGDTRWSSGVRGAVTWTP
jgi:hypothetical protein